MSEIKKGNISIHAQNIMPVIKRWLYSDKDIFIRELVANGCDAITKYRMATGEDSEDLHVTVTVDKENQELRFTDNGIGMTAEEVDQYINQVAFSGAEEFLKNYQGDDKGGIAEIMTLAETLINDPSIPHGKIGIAFTRDEEIGKGTEFFDVEGFGMDYAYTVDGGPIGELEYECFNAAEARIYFKGRDIHPGYAFNIMVNAVRIAAELDGMLPHSQRPEYTSDYEGFFHMTWMEGTSAEAESRYIIRDHDPLAFEEKKMVLQKCVDFLNGKYGDVITLEIREQYRNMKELIEPHMFLIDNAKAAFRACGVEPIIQPIRGGTDGADLTFKGLPCPNLSTGGMNFHSNTEYMPVQSMEKMAEVLIELARVK